MSSILLSKDSKHGKAGSVVSVPYGVGRELVKAGLGAYPAPPPPRAAARPAPMSPAERHAAEIQRLTEAHEVAFAELKTESLVRLADAEKAHRTEVAKLQADLEAANARITELQAKPKVQTQR